MKQKLYLKIKKSVLLPSEMRQKWLTLLENPELPDEVVKLMEQVFGIYEANVREVIEKNMSKEVYETFKEEAKKILSAIRKENESDADKEDLRKMQKIENELNNL